MINGLKRAHRYLYNMRVKHLVSYEHISKRVINRLKADTGIDAVKFELSVSYPVKYWFFVDGKRSTFSFDHTVIKALLGHTKFVKNSYDFVIETIYYSCLKEMVRMDNK